LIERKRNRGDEELLKRFEESIEIAEHDLKLLPLSAPGLQRAHPLFELVRLRILPIARGGGGPIAHRRKNGFSWRVMQKNFSPEDRLEILRAADRERKWHSLDDKRVCAICDRAFSGRQIEMWRDDRGRYWFRCPTEDCPANICHWFLGHRPSPNYAFFVAVKHELGFRQ
jgi:hypothetical protein